MGGTDTKIRVSTESQPWRRKFCRHSHRVQTWPFSHKSSTLTTELSPPPCSAYLQPSSPISTFDVYSASFFLILSTIPAVGYCWCKNCGTLSWDAALLNVLLFKMMYILQILYTFYSLSCHVGATMPNTSLWCAVLLVLSSSKSVPFFHRKLSPFFYFFLLTIE